MAVVAETFHPDVNGVSNSVSRVLEHLARRGHDAVVIAPETRSGHGLGRDTHRGFPVIRMPSFRPPMYRSVQISRPGAELGEVLAAFRPDVVHLASPALLGYAGAKAARDIGVPAVAVFQTDLAGYVARYHMRAARPLVWRLLRKLHGLTALTLVPSSAAAWLLGSNGIAPVARWGRGVDLDAFHPRHRSTTLRRMLADDDSLLVGYVGRLAAEKRVHLLAPLTDLPGIRVVIVGDGPARPALERRLPGAAFLGFRHGIELSQTIASLDVFVHPGADETFCQAVQEALAAGVPVVTSARGGPLDLIRHGENGWLWTDDDPGQLRAQVATLAADPELRASMARNARTSVIGRTWACLGDELLDHYRSVLRPAGQMTPVPVPRRPGAANPSPAA
ncbi:MAG TPA: glycosyltransferase family 1 protein [Mycobacteriales bacterium]|nr:glycosyltransferase family 1 protein [Mycobacteriales bacterium]